MKEFEKKESLFWDAYADDYNRNYHQSPLMHLHDEDFVNFVLPHYHEGDRVLDLGCGPGSLWTNWKTRFYKPQTLIGVDISEKAINICKQMFPTDDFRVGSVLNIPVESGSIDLLIVSSVLHHVPDQFLPQVFKEMSRVLDEHGTLVGREPGSKNRLGGVPGWFSGAIMAFRHMVYRLTHTREYPEPQIGDHHHTFVLEDFFNMLQEHFSPNSVISKYPLSSYVLRCNNNFVAKMVNLLDKSINHAGGDQFYYSAKKNYYDSSDIAFCIEQEIQDLTEEDKLIFMALLQKASQILEEELRS